MKLITLLILLVVSLSFAHTGRECPTCGYDQIPMWQGAIFGFIIFVLACFIFSLIFWAVHNWLRKRKEKKII